MDINDNTKCPTCKLPLMIVPTLRKELVTVGYCRKEKREYYGLPSGEWVDRAQWIKFKNEF